MSNLVGERRDRRALAALLSDMAERILSGDSCEGTIEYLAPSDASATAGFFDLRGAFRVGHELGHGEMRLIGRLAASSPVRTLG
jgi:hypothetical protein